MKLLFLSLFAVAVAAENSTLYCHCTAGSTDCKDGLCTTQGKGECVSVGYETEESASKPEQYKACQDSKVTFDACKEKYMFINTADNEFYLRSNTQCCNEDQCNEPDVKVPKENTTASHWGCPSCFALGSKSCDTRMWNCTLLQDLCIQITGTVMKGSAQRPFIIKGCATSTAAVLKKGAKLYHGQTTFSVETSHTQHAGTSRLLGNTPFAILIPTLFVLLLGKFQY